MDLSQPPLQLVRTDRDARSDGRARIARWGGALALHLLPVALLVSALPLKPKDLGGAFGSSVAVTLVSGAPRFAAKAQPPQPPQPPSLSNLERRLSDQGPSLAKPAFAAERPSPTRLSDLFDGGTSATGQTAAKGPPMPMAGGDDDPFARASVSYRGDDPAKASRLQSRAQSCAHGPKGLRLLLIINSEGYLVAKPRSLGAHAPDKIAAKAISAIERCAPFADAATPGPPRSYEIEVG